MSFRDPDTLALAAPGGERARPGRRFLRLAESHGRTGELHAFARCPAQTGGRAARPVTPGAGVLPSLLLFRRRK
jgi:hypothetical protein